MDEKTTEKKKRNRTAAQTRAVNKYNTANYDRINLTIYKGGKDIIKQYCTDNGIESVNTFINSLIAEKIPAFKAIRKEPED